jgi:hypothetical protein
MPHNPSYGQGKLSEQELSIRMIQYKDDSIVMAFDIRLK